MSMYEKQINSHDGIELNYAISETAENRPWIALVIPFGLKLNIAKYFFDFFESHYNVIVWESRSILEDSERDVSEGEFALENHVQDLHTVLSTIDAEQMILIGYCSGAGIALGAANRYPNMFNCLILVHGEYVMINDSTCMTQFSTEIDSLLSLGAKGENFLDKVYDKIKDQRVEDQSNRPDGLDMPFSKRAFFRRYCANYTAYKSVDFTHLAKPITHKTFMMIGKRDVQVNVKSTEVIRDLIPHSQLHIDPEADHYGLMREESQTMVTIWNYLCENELYKV